MPVSERRFPADSGARRGREASRPRKAMTIGAVCKILEKEFEDISISKIRYLEDQKLLAPRRTSGGYRLYSQNDVDRLRKILRMQRDEFLPLRVIRQELASGADAEGPEPARRPAAAASRRAVMVRTNPASLSLEDVVEETGAAPELVRELEEYGVISPERRGTGPVFSETECEIIRVSAELARFGVGARNLRVFRLSADRESSLLEALLGPSLRSKSPERRKEALENLENLAAIVSHLKHLLLVRDLRRLTRD